MKTWTPGRRSDAAGEEGGAPAFSISLALRPHYLTDPLPSDTLLDLVEETIKGGRVHSFLLAERAAVPDGLPTPALAKEILRRGGVPLVSIACADRGREEILGGMRTLHDEGVRDFLVVTGDYPRDPRPGGEEPLFDVDTVQLLMLLGEEVRGGALGDAALGCVVSPFKSLESELSWQYVRLQRKVIAGAEFIVSQAGFDARKWDELVHYRDRMGIGRPLIGHVMVPGPPTEEKIGKGLLPGVAMPPALRRRVEEERGRSGGRQANLRRAAAAVAIHRGLGYDGVLLGGGILDSDDLSFVLEEADRISPRWEEHLEEHLFPENNFYYFQAGSRGGRNAELPFEAKPGRDKSLAYLASYLIDYIVFGSRNLVFWTLYGACRFCDRRPFWGKLLWLVEYISKKPLYGCRMCGDCTLYATAFICYEDACPKKMLNGPCGGSIDGWCEVHPRRKRCLWVRAYWRLKGATPRPAFDTGPIPPKDRRLDGTCSWINFFLGRDHRKMDAGRGDPGEKST